MKISELNTFEHKITTDPIVSAYYDMNGKYAEYYIEDDDPADEEIYPTYYLGNGLKVETHLEAEFLLRTGDIVHDGGIRNRMLIDLQQGKNTLVLDQFEHEYDKYSWDQLFDEYMAIQSYIVN